MSRGDLLGGTLGEASARVAERVSAARAQAAARWTGTSWSRNADVPGSALRGRWRLPTVATRSLATALDRGSLTARGYDRVLRVAWTLADLGGIAEPGTVEVGAALEMRQPLLVAA